MVRLVEDLLDVSRIGQDKLSIRKAPVDLASVVDQAIEASASALQDGARCAGRGSRSPTSPVLADADARPPGAGDRQPVEQRRQVHARRRPGDLTLMRDGDEAVHPRSATPGSASRPSSSPRIFDMFMQAHGGSGRTGGLGLGLTLARSLVEGHGGRMTAHSEGLGRGTEFTIRLPLPPE